MKARWWWVKIFLCAYALEVTTGQRMSFGRCPDIKPLHDFDIQNVSLMTIHKYINTYNIMKIKKFSNTLIYCNDTEIGNIFSLNVGKLC